MPARRRRRSASSQTAAPSTGSRGRNGGRGNAARAAALAQPEERSGLWGWFQDAGDWVGETVDSATEAVSETVQGAAQTAGELWDVATSSDVDVDWSQRTLTVETDLDEVMDLVPAGVAQALQLDRTAADNRVRAVYDHRGGTVTLTADALELSGVQTDTVTSGPVSLQGVRLVLSNPGGGVPFVGEDTGVPLWQDSEDNLVADLTVAGLQAADVVVQGPDGPVRVAQLSLTDLTGQAEDGVQGLGGEGTIAGFSVAGAIASGVQGPGGVSVDQVTGTDLLGGLSAPGESAHLAAGALTATGAARGGQSLADAQVQGARVDVANTGGGMPFFDARADSLSGTASARSASVAGLDTASADLARAQATGLRGSFGGSSASVQAASLTGAGLDTGSVDAATLGLTDAAADLSFGAGGLRADATAAAGQATGLSSGTLSADSIRASALSGEVAPGALGAGAGRIDVAGARVGQDVTLDQATIHDASAGLVDGRGRVSAREASARGAAFRDTAQADTLSMAGFDARFDDASATVRADRVRAGGMTSRDGETTGGAASLEARGAQAAFAGGGITGSADQLLAEGAHHGDLSTARAEARGVTMGHAAGVTTLGTDAVALDDFSSPMARAARLEASGGSATLDAADMEAALDRVSLTDGTIADRLGVGSATFDGLTASRAGGVGRVGFDQGRATGLTDAPSGARAEAASIDGFSLTAQGDTVSSQAASLGATGLAAGDLRAASISGTGATSTVDGAGFRGGLDQLALRDAAYGDAASLGAADVSGLSLSASGDQQSAAFTEATARDVAYAGGGTRGSLGDVTVTGGGLQRDAQGVQGGAARVHAHDLRGQSTGGGAGGSGVDTRRLGASAAGLVDDASLRAQVPLRAGDLGPVTARRGTTVDAQVGVRGGRFVPGATRASFSRPLDGPAWTSASGVYMTDQHRLKADVNGWFDQDVGGSLNESLGLRGKQVPSVATLGQALTRPSRGGGGGGSLSDSVDLDRLRASGSVGLRGGTLDAGGAGSATLSQPRQAGDNRLDVSYTGADGLRAQADRLRLDAAQASGVRTGRTSVDDARVSVDRDGTTRGSARNLDARDVRFSSRS